MSYTIRVLVTVYGTALLAFLLVVTLCLFFVKNRLSKLGNQLDKFHVLPTAAKVVAEIPKRIWTYWDGPVDEFVHMCVERCRRMNPGYEITVLNSKTIRTLVPELPEHLLRHPNFKDSAARTADLVRSVVIAHQGGIWMDASIVCIRPFDEWLDRKAQFVGFYIQSFTQQPHNPVVENWFFASQPGCRFMQEWCREFARLSQFKSADEYVDHLKAAGVSMQGISPSLRSYLAMHCAAQKVMQQTLPGVASVLNLQPAEEGPFVYLAHPDVKWDSKTGIRRIISHWRELVAAGVPFLKLRGDERRAMDDLSEREHMQLRKILQS